MEGRRHGDGRFKLAVEARHEHIGLLFGNSKRSERSRNTGEGEERSHHDIAVRPKPVTNIVTTHEGHVRRPLGVHRDFLLCNLGSLFVGHKGFPQFPGTTIKTTALAIHLDAFTGIPLDTCAGNVTGTGSITGVSHEDRLVLCPGIGTFPHAAAVQTVVECNHILTRIDLTMLGVLEVKITAVESRFQLEVDTGHVRGVAQRTCIKVGFVLAPARETGRVGKRIRRVEARLEEHEFSRHRPAFDILALSLDIETDLRACHSGSLSIAGITGRSLRRIKSIDRSRLIEDRGIRNAYANVSHQEELRSEVALHISTNHVRVEEHRTLASGNPLVAEFVFVNGTLVIRHAHVVQTDRKIVGNLFLGNTAMEDSAAEIVATGHFKFARLTTIHTQTITGRHVGINRLRHEELGLHVVRELVDVGKDTTERAVRPECTATFLDRFESFFFIVGRNCLFVFEKFVLPNETRVRFTFPHRKRRSVRPNDTACGNVGTEDTCADIDTNIQFFVDGRRIEVRGVVVQSAFIVIARGLSRMLRQVVRINATQIKRERKIRKQRNVGVRHGDDVHVQDGIDARASPILLDPGAFFGIVEILQTESHVTGDRQWQIVLAEESRFHVTGKSIQRSVQGIKLQLRREGPRSTEARRQ